MPTRRRTSRRSRPSSTIWLGLIRCRRNWWRVRSARRCDAYLLLLRLLKTCAFALVLVDAFATVLAFALVLVDAFVTVLALALVFVDAHVVALVGDCGVIDGDCVFASRSARMVVKNIQWQYSCGRLLPLDRLDSDFPQSLSVRKVRGWRREPHWNLGFLYQTLHQPTLTNTRVFPKRLDLGGHRHGDSCNISVHEHHLWARIEITVGVATADRTVTGLWLQHRLEERAIVFCATEKAKIVPSILSNRVSARARNDHVMSFFVCPLRQHLSVSPAKSR